MTILWFFFFPFWLMSKTNHNNMWLACITIYFNCLNLEAGLRTQRLITKGEYHKMVIWTHNRNKQTSSTAGNARGQDNIDYKCVTGGFLGTKWEIDEAQKPLFCTSHDGPTRSISFNPRVLSGTIIFISFSFDANFYSNFIFFHFRSKICLTNADMVTRHS